MRTDSIVIINLVLLLANLSIFTTFGGNTIISHEFYYLITVIILFLLTILNLLLIRSLNFKLLNDQIFIIFIIIQVIGLFSSIFYGDFIYAIKFFLYYIILFTYISSFISLKCSIKEKLVKDIFLVYCKIIVLISILFYFLELIFNFKIMEGHVGYGLINIIGGPALEGVAGTLTSTFYACVVVYSFLFSNSINKYRPRKLFYFILSILLILLSVKRTAFFVLVFGLLFVSFNSKIKFMYKVIIFLLTILFASLFIDYLEIIYSGGVIDQDPFYSRSYVFSVIQYIFNTSPAIGLGLGFHNYSFFIFNDSSLTDSSPLSFVVDTGFIGLLLFVYWIGYGVYRAYCYTSSTSSYSIFGMLLVFYLYSFFIDLFNNPFDLFTFFLLIYTSIAFRPQNSLNIK